MKILKRKFNFFKIIIYTDTWVEDFETNFGGGGGKLKFWKIVFKFVIKLKTSIEHDSVCLSSSSGSGRGGVGGRQFG